MSWIDCKVRRPTIEDASKHGDVFWLRDAEHAFSGSWDARSDDLAAWMPIPEFVRPPKPPKGYRVIDPATEPFNPLAIWYLHGRIEWQLTLNAGAYGPDIVYAVPIEPPEPPKGYEVVTDLQADPHPDALYFSAESGEFRPRNQHRGYINGNIYAVPIEPPKPQYRPFKNAAEFRPFQHLWWKAKGASRHYPPRKYDETGTLSPWKDMFTHFEFQDGQPFGVRIGGEE